MHDTNDKANDGLSEALAQARQNWGWLVALGVALLVAGGFAVAQAVLFTMASMIMIGALMIIGALTHIIAAFRGQGWKHFLLWLAGGILYLIAGLVTIANPLLASSFLTLLIGASLLASGIARVWMGIKARPDQGWGWLLTGGLITLLLGLVIATGWPVNSLWLIGLFLGIELVMQGWSYIALGIALRARA